MTKIKGVSYLGLVIYRGHKIVHMDRDQVVYVKSQYHWLLVNYSMLCASAVIGQNTRNYLNVSLGYTYKNTAAAPTFQDKDWTKSGYSKHQ